MHLHFSDNLAILSSSNTNPSTNGTGNVVGAEKAYDFGEAKSYCESLGDWRLATVEEMRKIFIKRKDISVAFQMNSASFWTSTPENGDEDFQMVVGNEIQQSKREFL